MKATIENIIYKDGNEETFNWVKPSVSYSTFIDLQFKGTKALKNLKNQLKKYALEGDLKDMKSTTLKLVGYSDTIVVEL